MIGWRGEQGKEQKCMFLPGRARKSKVMDEVVTSVTRCFECMEWRNFRFG
jgi:hypothetical protein